MLIFLNHVNPARDMVFSPLVQKHNETVSERLLCRLAKLIQLGARDVVKEFSATACHLRRIAKTEPEFHV